MCITKALEAVGGGEGLKRGDVTPIKEQWNAAQKVAKKMGKKINKGKGKERQAERTIESIPLFFATNLNPELLIARCSKCTACSATAPSLLGTHPISVSLLSATTFPGGECCAGHQRRAWWGWGRWWLLGLAVNFPSYSSYFLPLFSLPFW